MCFLSFIIVCMVSKVLWGLLVFQGDGPSVNEGLQELDVFSLEHHSRLLPTLFSVVFTLSINVHSFMEIKYSNVEGFPLTDLIFVLKMHILSFPVGFVSPACHCVLGGEFRCL